MPNPQEQEPQEGQPSGGQSVSHPSFELKERISQAVILQLVGQSQLVLQNLLAHQEVWDNMAVFYPKSFESLVQLVAAFEQLSVLLQEVGALQDVQEQEPEEEKKPAEKKSPKKGGPKSEVEGKGRHKAIDGEEKEVKIGNRLYRRRYSAQDHKWHYVSRQHRQVVDQKELQRPKPGQEN